LKTDSSDISRREVILAVFNQCKRSLLFPISIILPIYKFCYT